MSMSKKDFISLADALRDSSFVGSQAMDEVLDMLASWCATQNPRFMRDRWIDYVHGNCGPNGGAVKHWPAVEAHEIGEIK